MLFHLEMKMEILFNTIPENYLIQAFYFHQELVLTGMLTETVQHNFVAVQEFLLLDLLMYGFLIRLVTQEY